MTYLRPVSPGSSLKGTRYTIGELAREFDVTTRAIRFYESEGLLSPVRVGNRRYYRRRDRTRLKLILRGRRLGFTLAEIGETFELYDQAHGEAKQLRYYLEVLRGKRAQLQSQMQDLRDTLVELEQSYAHCEKLLAAQERRNSVAEEE